MFKVKGPKQAQQSKNANQMHTSARARNANVKTPGRKREQTIRKGRSSTSKSADAESESKRTSECQTPSELRVSINTGTAKC